MAFAGLTGKVAVVTGAGSGIGAGVAGRLSEEEAHVVVVDRDENRATTVAGVFASSRWISASCRLSAITVGCWSVYCCCATCSCTVTCESCC